MSEIWITQLEADLMKRCKELEEENKKLDEAYQIARDRVIELLWDIELYLEHIKELEEENETLRDTNGDLQRWLKQTEDMLKFQQEENKKLREENEVLKEYKSMYEWLIVN